MVIYTSILVKLIYQISVTNITITGGNQNNTASYNSSTHKISYTLFSANARASVSSTITYTGKLS